MKTLKRVVIVSLLVALAQGCSLGSIKADSSDLARTEKAESGKQANTRILVTFNDERVDRIPLGDTVNAYRARGNYGNSTWSVRVAERFAQAYGLSAVAQWPITTLGVHCVVYEIPATRSTEEVLRQLESDSRVESVQTMRQFQVMNSFASYSDPYYKLQAGLRELHLGDIHPEVTGRNVRVAVIDTGIDDHHQDLTGQLERVENYVPETEHSAGEMHGTAVAGIIAAVANNGRGIVGIAPGAKLMSLKACWQENRSQPEAQCNTFTLALALNTAIGLKPQILNMSLSGPEDPLLGRLIDKALDEGIIVVASAAPKPETGNVFPASMRRVIAVQAVPENNASASEKSASNLIAAPGNEILTTLPHDGYSFMTGSSFAAAHVSGVIALLLEKRPQLSSNQVFEILKKSSEINALGSEKPHGIDACAAISRVGAMPCDNSPSIATGTSPVSSLSTAISSY
ncbi:MAG: Subtilisin [Proteobacteria bacterium]|nr:Subtilisin [Pseudomonadota bacterium]